MTEPERAALDHIRRVVDSVIGESSPEETVSPQEIASMAVPGRVSFNCLPVPYLSQMMGEGTVNDSGAVVGAMLVQAYTGKSLTPAEFLNQNGQFNETALTLAQVSNVLRMNGVPVETRSGLKLSDLVLILFSGRPAIVLVRQIVLQQGGLTTESFDGPHHLVCVGMDLRYVYTHDPLRRDASGQAQPIPWLTFHRAWTQASGAERAALVPRMQLIRRIKITAATLNVRQEPNDETSLAGTVTAGDVYEVSAQRDGWGKIGENRWINLSYVNEI